MIVLIDFDVRALGVIRPLGAGLDERAVLSRVGRMARFAAFRGLDAIGVVERYPAMQGPGALEALAGVARAGEGVIAWESAATAIPGAELRTCEGLDVVLYGPAERLLSLAGAFPASLFAGFRPSLARALGEARLRSLLSLVRAPRSAHETLLTLGRDPLRLAHGLLLGPGDTASSIVGGALRLPAVAGSGARRSAGVGAVRTALDVERGRRVSLEALRSALGDRAVAPLGGRNVLSRVYAEGAAALHTVLERVRPAPSLLGRPVIPAA